MSKKNSEPFILSPSLSPAAREYAERCRKNAAFPKRLYTPVTELDPNEISTVELKPLLVGFYDDEI